MDDSGSKMFPKSWHESLTQQCNSFMMKPSLGEPPKSGQASFKAISSLSVTKWRGLVGKSMMSWADAGRRSPVERVSGEYFFCSNSSLASSSSFFLRYYSSFLASSSASFLFLGGIQTSCDNNQWINYRERMFAYNHPLLTQGAGRIKTDPLNDDRIETVLDRFEKYAQKNSIALQYNIDGSQLMRSKIAFPLAGFTIGVISSMAFVHPGSRYIGKFFTALTTFLGYQLHARYQQAHNSSRYFGNFPRYPADIQRMIDNHDARYAFRWLRDDFMDIENSPQLEEVQ